MLRIIRPLPRDHKLKSPSLNGITHTKHEQEQHVTVVHSVSHQFWSGIHCTWIICVIKFIPRLTCLERGMAIGRS